MQIGGRRVVWSSSKRKFVAGGWLQTEINRVTMWDRFFLLNVACVSFIRVWCKRASHASEYFFKWCVITDTIFGNSQPPPNLPSIVWIHLFFRHVNITSLRRGSRWKPNIYTSIHTPEYSFPVAEQTWPAQTGPRCPMGWRSLTGLVGFRRDSAFAQSSSLLDILHGAHVNGAWLVVGCSVSHLTCRVSCG